jgi:hypothetical protein
MRSWLTLHVWGIDHTVEGLSGTVRFSGYISGSSSTAQRLSNRRICRQLETSCFSLHVWQFEGVYHVIQMQMQRNVLLTLQYWARAGKHGNWDWKIVVRTVEEICYCNSDVATRRVPCCSGFVGTRLLMIATHCGKCKCSFCGGFSVINSCFRKRLKSIIASGKGASLQLYRDYTLVRVVTLTLCFLLYGKTRGTLGS